MASPLHPESGNSCASRRALASARVCAIAAIPTGRLCCPTGGAVTKRKPDEKLERYLVPSRHVVVRLMVSSIPNLPTATQPAGSKAIRRPPRPLGLRYRMLQVGIAVPAGRIVLLPQRVMSGSKVDSSVKPPPSLSQRSCSASSLAGAVSMLAPPRLNSSMAQRSA